MIDKKQVMFDIERCISHVPDACRDCSHYTGTVGFGCMENLMTDALALLKEQEPQSVIFDRQCEVEPGRWERKGFCPKCHQVVLWIVNREYCGFCGQKVKWDD